MWVCWWWVDPNATAWMYQWPKNQLVGCGFVFFVWGADAIFGVCSTKAGVDAAVVGYLLHSSLTDMPTRHGTKKFFKLFIHMCGTDCAFRFCCARTYDNRIRIRSLLLAVMTSYPTFNPKTCPHARTHARIPRHIAFIASFGYAYHLPAHSSVRSFVPTHSLVTHTLVFLISCFFFVHAIWTVVVSIVFYVLSCTAFAYLPSYFFFVFFLYVRFLRTWDAATVVDR